MYFMNVPGMQAAGGVIDGLVAPTVTERLQEFHTALEYGSFANQEIVEQLAQQAMQILRNPNIPQGEKEMIVKRAELELLKLADEKPGDARVHNFISAFYRSIGAMPQAREQAALAASLSPEKPSLLAEQAIVELQDNKVEAAAGFLKKAYELEDRNIQVRVLYAATLMQLGQFDQATEIIGEAHKDAFAMNDYALSVTEATGEFVYLSELFEIRVAKQPNNAQHRASLAFIYHQLGEKDKAIAVLNAAAEAVPEFAQRAQCYAANLEAGNEPGEGCDE